MRRSVDLRSHLARAAVAVAALLGAAATADEPFREPPANIVALMDAPLLPKVSTSPDGNWLLLRQPKRWTDYNELADVRRATPPSASLPANETGPDESYLLVRVSDGARWAPGSLTGELRYGPLWAPDGHRFIFFKRSEHGEELWIADPVAHSARRLTGPKLHTLLDRRMGRTTPADCEWMPDGTRVLCHTIPDDPDPPPARNPAPHLEEVRSTDIEGLRQNRQRAMPLIVSDYDEAVYDHAMTSQPVLVDVTTGRITSLGAPGIYRSIAPSPDGNWFLVERVVRPYSRWDYDLAFPHEVEVWHADGTLAQQLDPIQPSRVRRSGPIEIIFRQGPRDYAWRPDVPASVVYEYGVDGSDAADRDRLLQIDAPFTAPPVELYRARDGFISGVRWGEGGLLTVSEFIPQDRAGPRTLMRLDAQGRALAAPVGLGGAPLSAGEWGGASLLVQDGDWVYVRAGGELARVNVETGARESIYQLDAASRESLVAVLDPQASRLLTRAYDDFGQPATFGVVDTATGARRVLVEFPNPTLPCMAIEVRRVRYSRADGLALGGTLYLPPDWSGAPRPAIVVGYPYDRVGPKPTTEPIAPSAAPVEGPHPFADGCIHQGLSASVLAIALLPLEGYAVFEADMPFLGTSIEDAYDNNYIDDIVADAEAAVAALTALGVAEPSRVGVAGSSFGGMMTANLLAHTDGLFAAGIADAGNYLPPRQLMFYQNELRPLWEARASYLDNAAFLHAEGITEPLLLLHGEHDSNVDVDNSRQLYDALQSLGANSRLVIFPNENHVYFTREASMHEAWEMLSWFEQHLKRGRAPAEARDAGADGDPARE